MFVLSLRLKVTRSVYLDNSVKVIFERPAFGVRNRSAHGPLETVWSIASKSALRGKADISPTISYQHTNFLFRVGKCRVNAVGEDQSVTHSGDS